ncbi:serine hydrolase [Streptomyces sp. NPDC002265]|uniref:serine hydrolase n=1 Tax=Streptomyces sp. NPDC002265 TaxID=3154415 RepID=UPI00332FFF4B
MPASRIPRLARRGLAAAMTAGTALAAFATATPAQASTGGASVGGSPVTCTSQRPGLADRLSQDLAAALRGRQGSTALALYDRATGTSCAFRAHAAFDSASVVKVTVLGALLRQTADEHRALTSREVELTTAMITKSDNDATNALWHQLGTAGVQRFLTLAGMRDTVPAPNGHWGRTQITAADQLTLLRLLTSDNAVLGPGARAYALRLMSQVIPEQRWGAPAGAPTTATVHVKNGWLPDATDGWRVNSVGAFTGGGHDYAMAVLSDGSRTMADGVATLEAAARVVNRDLNTPAAV